MIRRSMDFRAAALVVGALAVFALAHAEASAAGPKALSRSGKAELDKALVAAVDRGDTPGVVGLVAGPEGVLYEGTAGKLETANDEPMRPDAIFNIASMTKPVTSVAIMMLREEGKLQLDDPVSKYLEGFDNLRVIDSFNEVDGTYVTRPARRPMTIRHLLTHTSGIGYAFSSPIVGRLQQGTQHTEWQIPLLHDPGDRWTYGASTRVLGMIVEKLTGEVLEAYYQRRIFQPLGMVDTSFAVVAEKQARLPTSHRRNGTALQEQPRPVSIPTTAPTPSRGDGGLYSTAQDYGRFIRMFLNGGQLGPARILSGESVRLMGENHIGPVFVELQPVGNAALTKPFPLGAGRDEFGLGFQITAAGDTKHRSPGSLSWAGIQNTEFWIDPQKKVGGVLLMQLLPFYDDGAIRTLREFEEAVYRNLN